MRFWDTSALLLLVVDDARSAWARSLLRGDPDIVAWWGTLVECASAAVRLRREGRIDAGGEGAVIRLVERLRASWVEIQPSDEVRTRSLRALRVHPLRAPDALQLAAAQTWAGSHGGSELVTLDHRLAEAARAEGFEVLMPGA